MAGTNESKEITIIDAISVIEISSKVALIPIFSVK
tara:strand:- start:2460 stop:2564 length:105 start_codon:yes stop_codon:yes gene_type:complete